MNSFYAIWVIEIWSVGKSYLLHSNKYLQLSRKSVGVGVAQHFIGSGPNRLTAMDHGQYTVLAVAMEKEYIVLAEKGCVDEWKPHGAGWHCCFSCFS